MDRLAPMCGRMLEQLPEGARMIDVDEMAIVEAPRNCRLQGWPISMAQQS